MSEIACLEGQEMSGQYLPQVRASDAVRASVKRPHTFRWLELLSCVSGYCSDLFILLVVFHGGREFLWCSVAFSCVPPSAPLRWKGWV